MYVYPPAVCFFPTARYSETIGFVREDQRALRVRFSGIERCQIIALCVGGERLGQRGPFGGGEVLKRYGVGRKIACEGKICVRVDAGDIVEVKRDGRNGFSVMAVLDREAHVPSRINRARSSRPHGKQRKQAKNAKSRRADSLCPVSHGGSSIIESGFKKARRGRLSTSTQGKLRIRIGFS